jgi:hypothetical protein
MQGRWPAVQPDHDLSLTVFSAISGGITADLLMSGVPIHLRRYRGCRSSRASGKNARAVECVIERIRLVNSPVWVSAIPLQVSSTTLQTD